MLLRRFSLFPSCKEGIKAGDMTFGELTNYMARHVYLEEMTQKARACLQADDLTGYERIADQTLGGLCRDSQCLF